jgi:hypothetical protein
MRIGSRGIALPAAAGRLFQLSDLAFEFIGTDASSHLGNDPNLTFPAGTQAGDFAILNTHGYNAVTLNQSGWTTFFNRSDSGNNNYDRHYYKILTSADISSNLTFSSSNARYTMANMLIFRPSTGISVSSVTTGSSTIPFDITTTQSNCIVGTALSINFGRTGSTAPAPRPYDLKSTNLSPTPSVYNNSSGLAVSNFGEAQFNFFITISNIWSRADAFLPSATTITVESENVSPADQYDYWIIEVE